MSSVDHPTAAVLIIGAEILSGKFDDANGPYLIRGLRARGIELRELRTIRDDIDTIAEAINALRGEVSYIFTTGGIGPTHDDVTIDAIASALGLKVVEHPLLLKKLQEHYGEVSIAQRRLARVPQGAQVEVTDDSAIPIIRIENIFIFAGVPAMMRTSFEGIGQEISAAPFHSLSIYVNIDESVIAGAIAEIQSLHSNVAIGSYPRFDRQAPYRIRLTIDGREQRKVVAAHEAIIDSFDADWLIELSDDKPTS